MNRRQTLRLRSSPAPPLNPEPSRPLRTNPRRKRARLRQRRALQPKHRTPLRRPLPRHSARSGRSSRGRIADAADLTIVADAADAIAAGAARAAGVTAGRAAIYPLRNTRRPNHLIPVHANRSRTSRLRLITSPLFFRENRSPSIKIAFPLRLVLWRLPLKLVQARKRYLRLSRHKPDSRTNPNASKPLCNLGRACRIRCTLLCR